MQASTEPRTGRDGAFWKRGWRGARVHRRDQQVPLNFSKAGPREVEARSTATSPPGPSLGTKSQSSLQSPAGPSRPR